ncbi:hypothetical protein QUF64_14350 [Anaerolineales bacterium HSG6]|nr:hypothetical protein [Anaerolineales bacterium HSG6]
MIRKKHVWYDLWQVVPKLAVALLVVTGGLMILLSFHVVWPLLPLLVLLLLARPLIGLRCANCDRRLVQIDRDREFVIWECVDCDYRVKAIC